MNTLKANDLPSQRLLSLDTLRGFDMFWIIGGDTFFWKLAGVTGWSWAVWWSKQLSHVSWEGFRFYDLVLPLFVFLSGVTIPYAIVGKHEKGMSKKALYKKVAKRVLLLFLLGFACNGNLSRNYSDFRYPSVLGLIGIGYFITTLIVLNTKTIRTRILWVLGVLLGYACLQMFVSIGDYGGGDLTAKHSINSLVDQTLLPGRFYNRTMDNLGILCMISASTLTLMGSLAGEVLRLETFSQMKKVCLLALTGAIMVGFAWGLSFVYPLIKSLWTSSFNILTGGLSLLLIALFYLVIDVWRFQKWTFFFRIIGLNSITIYVAVRFISFQYTTDKIFGGLAGLTGDMEPLVLLVGLLTVEWLFLYFLYRKNIFLKV